MLDVRTIDDIYPAVREIIEELRKAGLENQAAILTHRMTKVAWTSRDELFEELVKVLAEVVTKETSNLPAPLSDQIRVVLGKLREVL